MKKKKTRKKPEKEIKPPPAPEKEEPFDFGGLPHRDLKKSLGCG